MLPIAYNAILIAYNALLQPNVPSVIKDITFSLTILVQYVKVNAWHVLMHYLAVSAPIKAYTLITVLESAQPDLQAIA
jgi:hypothetical protein